MSRLNFILFLLLVTLPYQSFGRAVEDDRCMVQPVDNFDKQLGFKEILPSIVAVRVCDPENYLGLGPIQKSGNGYRYFQVRDLSQLPGQNTSATFVLAYGSQPGKEYGGRWVVIDSHVLGQEVLLANLEAAAALSQCIANHSCFDNVFANFGFWNTFFGGDVVDGVKELSDALRTTAGTVLTMHYRDSTNIAVLMGVGSNTINVQVKITDGWSITGLSYVDI